MKDLQSLDEKMWNTWHDVGDFIYSHMDLVNDSMGKLWDFYDVYPSFYNSIKEGRCSLETLLNYDYDRINKDLGDILKTLSEVQANVN